MWKSRWPSGAPVPNKPDGFCGREATVEDREEWKRSDTQRGWDGKTLCSCVNIQESFDSR